VENVRLVVLWIEYNFRRAANISCDACVSPARDVVRPPVSRALSHR